MALESPGRKAISPRTHRIAASAASTVFVAMSIFIKLKITTADDRLKRFCTVAMFHQKVQKARGRNEKNTRVGLRV